MPWSPCAREVLEKRRRSSTSYYGIDPDLLPAESPSRPSQIAKDFLHLQPSTFTPTISNNDSNSRWRQRGGQAAAMGR